MRDAVKIVVADDSAANRRLLSRIFAREQYDVHLAACGAAALEMVRRETPDLVVSDLVMPRMDGLELCRRVKADPAVSLTPVIIVTGRHETGDRIASIEAGADDLIRRPFSTKELVARARALLRLKGRIDRLDSAESVILTLAATVEARDPYTHGHCERLARYASLLGRAIGLREADLATLRKGGHLHDLGKIAVPDSILLKPGPLTVGEFQTLKQHSIVGERLCGQLRSLAAVRPIIRHHHERLDGSGYPDGLRGHQIPLLAQIIGIVDTYDAIVTTRPYRQSRPRAEACLELRSDAKRGRFDCDLVDAFLSSLALDDDAVIDGSCDGDAHPRWAASNAAEESGSQWLVTA